MVAARQRREEYNQQAIDNIQQAIIADCLLPIANF
jgi:hypothetical protein